jgi:CheY-like chemotaxis protein
MGQHWILLSAMMLVQKAVLSSGGAPSPKEKVLTNRGTDEAAGTTELNHKTDENAAVPPATVTLAGTVNKIFPAIGELQPEKAQIAVEGAEPLYREIRIDNSLQDGAGNAVGLKVGAEVEVTIKAIKNAPDNGHAKDNNKIRILIADDQPTILKMVKQILQAHTNFEVVGEAPDGQQAVTLAGSLKPDVIVLNVSMPAMSGFEAARRIRSHLPDSAIVILSSHKDKQFIAEAREAGARGYVQKSDADGQLIQAINTVVKGEEFFFLE